MRARVFVFMAALAVGLALPVPARARVDVWGEADWSTVVKGGPWGMTVDAQSAVVTIQSGWVRALSLEGRSKWETAVDGVAWANPAITRDAVLVGATGRVVALDRKTGALRWEQPLSGEITAVALAGRYALAGDPQGDLRAFDASTGRPAWDVHYDGEVVSAPQVDLDRAIVVAAWHFSAEPAVRGLDLATGAPRWIQKVSELTAAPVVHGGHAYVATGDGHHRAWVAALDLTTGRADWALIVPASFQSGVVPGVDKRDVVVADQLGGVSAVDAHTGHERWRRELKRPVVETSVVLLPRRVVLTSVTGELFVLDRVTGRIIARGDMQTFDGLPSGVERFDRSRVLVALGATAPATVELRRVP